MSEKEKFLNPNDYYNKERQRNVNNTNSKVYNCGGFALRTYSWYMPDHSCDLSDEDFINELYNDGYEYYEIYDELLQRSTQVILEDFCDTLELCDRDTIPNEGEDKIAFRVGIDEYDVNDSDFHFRVFRDGQWYEKCGSRDIHKCEFTEEPWEGEEHFIYDSDIVYFIHHIE